MFKTGNRTQKTLLKILVPILFIIILGASVYLRVRGLFWGEYQFLHPDERFLVWVGSSISSVDKLADYFNTHVSSLNPNNRGHTFFVYGDFPIILTRYIAELISDLVGWNEITQVGRSLSALFDLGSVILIFFIGKKLFGKWTGLLAAAFSGFAVLQIQQSHFYTVDTFATFFTTLAVLIVVIISKFEFKYRNKNTVALGEVKRLISDKLLSRLPNYKTLVLSIFFGIIVGLAGASKINTITIALLLPVAFVILWDSYPIQDPSRKNELILRDLIAGAVFAIISFRIFQPYAFEGPGFLGVKLNELWINNLREVSAQSGGKVDFPPALQWARRSFFFSAKNLSLWGVGLPLSITAWLGIFTMGWRMLRGEWRKFLLIWIWTVGYFLWQSSLGNSVMRYQMPVYPMFALMAAWFIYFLFTYQPVREKWKKIFRIFGVGFTLVALVGTFIWAFMFSSIYEKPITRIEASRWIYENIPGPINLMVSQDGKTKQNIISFPYDYQISDTNPYINSFTVLNEGSLQEIQFVKIIQLDDLSRDENKLIISIYDLDNSGSFLGSVELTGPFDLDANSEDKDYSIPFPNELNLEKEHTYQIIIEYQGTGVVTLLGSATTNESSWDDGLPLRIDGYDGYGGIYQKDLSFEMYWEDNQDKYDRFTSLLYQSDYLFISSNRQWGTTTRVPERYPLTTKFYQALLGCPTVEDLYYCYSTANPGTYKGNLGYELVQVFESYPTIGNFEINDQFADEAFTVYDHPKVLIFKKSTNYDPVKVSQILGEVDLSKVLFYTPGEFPDYPADLMLPESQEKIQQAGGTWSAIFDTSSLLNQNQVVAVVVWYLAFTILGIIIYPLVRLGFNGLIDKGYGFSKLFALLFISFLVWFGGSNGISVTRGFIWLVIGFIVLLNLLIVYFTKQEIIKDFKQLKSVFLWLEIVSLVLFVSFLLVRLGNPDLWHPEKGGEKPMDFSYLNAVIKSTTFPPYDPWYEGGYINYYYYGFVIIGVFIKWIGIIPSLAYNLVLPSWFSFMGIGAFSIIWNLFSAFQRDSEGQISYPEKLKNIVFSNAGKAGISGIFLTLILGNLGTVRMIWHGLQKIGSIDGVIEGANFIQRWVWSFKGFAGLLSGQHLPFYPGDWYWVPSRALPQEPITEFPYFTFIYADPHAHLLAMPITIMAIAWTVSIVLSKWNFNEIIPGWLSKLVLIFVGAVTIGTLRPTNTWDFPTYLVLGIVIIYYTILRYGKGFRTSYRLNNFLAKLLEATMITVVFVVLSFVLFEPFTRWYGQAYTQIEIWNGSYSPFWSYFTHWGLFLFILISWCFVETIQWMAVTPLSSAKKLFRHVFIIWIGLAAIFSAIILLLLRGIIIAWLVIPLLVWIGVLILRKDLPDSKRFVLFLSGTALVLTMMVELIVLKGDIGRMNTVFKFYLQAWILLAISSGAALFWTLSIINKRWSFTLRNVWQIGLITLVSCALLYPLTATLEKINHRISELTPLTLDGMKYMETSTYFDEGTTLDLSEDYAAIKWMQENILGSPVIVEANTVEYRWGSRYSIYTGLPGVVGWNWHQRQQRAVVPSSWVTDRVDDINNFYLTSDLETTRDFLEEYDVSYIIVGQLEKAKYLGDGLIKFSQLDGKLWNAVYSQGETTIYQVIK